MHLEIEHKDLKYIAGIIGVLRGRCKAHNSQVHLLFTEEDTKFVFEAQGFSMIYKHNYISEAKGSIRISTDLIKNMLNLFDDGIIQIDTYDMKIVTQQDGTILKSQGCTSHELYMPKITKEELEEIPLKVDLSNRLLNLDLEEVGIDVKDPYAQLYNVCEKRLVKMSSYCALLQTLKKETPCNVTLTQDIFCIYAAVKGEAQCYKFRESFYIRSGCLEIRAPLANVKFPNINAVMQRIEQGSQNFLIKTSDWLNVCEKCRVLNLPKKIERLNVVFNNGLVLYEYNGVLNGSFESGLELDWKFSINPMLLRGILKYINEDCITICKNSGNNILLHNEDKSIQFMLALCK